MGPYIPYGLFQTTEEMCAKFGSDRFRNVDLYKVQTNIQTFIFIYKIYCIPTFGPPCRIQRHFTFIVRLQLKCDGTR